MVNRAKGCIGDLNETCEEARQQVMGRILWLKKIQHGGRDHLLSNIVHEYFLKLLRNSRHYLFIRY